MLTNSDGYWELKAPGKIVSELKHTGRNAGFGATNLPLQNGIFLYPNNNNPKSRHKGRKKTVIITNKRQESGALPVVLQAIQKS